MWAYRFRGHSTNMVRRSLPFFLFSFRILLRSAPLLRSYRVRLLGIHSFVSRRRLSEPERVPPLSMNAIKLSKPLIGSSPEKGSPQSNYIGFYMMMKKGGGEKRYRNHICKWILFQCFRPVFRIGLSASGGLNWPT